MSQILIIDVQNTYRSHAGELINELPAYAKNFSQILYLYDNINGQEFYEEVPEEWMEDEDFYDRLESFTKNYAFFRGLMDKGCTDEDIVDLAKFMMNNRLTDGREIKEDEDCLNKFKNHFKNSTISDIDFDDYTFYIPDDLVQELQSRLKNGVVLVGGGSNECLKEVSLLLKALDIQHSINFEYTY